MGELSPKAFGRSLAIDTESHRLKRMIKATEAAQKRCEADKDRDMYDGELAVFRGLLSVLERSKAAPQIRPDQAGGGERGR